MLRSIHRQSHEIQSLQRFFKIFKYYLKSDLRVLGHGYYEGKYFMANKDFTQKSCNMVT